MSLKNRLKKKICYDTYDEYYKKENIYFKDLADEFSSLVLQNKTIDFINGNEIHNYYLIRDLFDYINNHCNYKIIHLENNTDVLSMLFNYEKSCDKGHMNFIKYINDNDNHDYDNIIVNNIRNAFFYNHILNEQPLMRKTELEIKKMNYNTELKSKNELEKKFKDSEDKIKILEDKLLEHEELIKDIYEGPYGRVYFESLEHFNELKQI